MVKQSLKNASRYKNNVTVSKGKAFFTSFAELAMVFVFSFFFYVAISYPIIGALPIVKEAETSYQADQDTLNNLTEGLRLKVKDGDEYLTSEEMAKNYLITLSKTSYFLEGKNYPSMKESEIPDREETFFNIGGGENDYPLDNVSYYFYNVKGRVSSLSSYVYDGIDYAAKKEECLYSVFFDYQDLSLFESRSDELPLCQQLAKDKAEMLADYLVYGGPSTSASGKLYDSLKENYLHALSMCIEEVEAKYEPYLDAMTSFDRSYGVVVSSHLIGFTLAYVLGWAVNEFILPLFFKDHRTLSMKMMRVAYSTVDETEVRWWNALLKSLVRLPLYFCVIFVSMAFLGIQNFSLYSFGGFRFIALLGFSLLALLASGVFELVLPTHQALEELTGGLIMKDLDYYEAGEALEDKKKEAGHGE